MRTAQIPTNRKVILCQYSGGLDSMGVLYHLLTDPKWKGYHIHVHHMDLYNVENRMKAERQAVDKSLEWFKSKGYSFTYSTSYIKAPYVNQVFPMDRDISTFIAATICAVVPSIKYVAIGTIKDDEANPGSTDGTVWCDAIFLQLRKGSKAERLHPLRHMTGQQIRTMLPPELAALAWSCRTPKYTETGQPIHCGSCPKCKDPAKRLRGEDNA